MKLFIFGLGYTALQFVEKYRDRFDKITGTVRSEAKRDRLAGVPCEVLLFNDGIADPQIGTRASEADCLLISTPTASGTDPVLSAFPNLLAACRLSRVVYLSTIGVYADSTGRWIDETAPLTRSQDRRGARIAAENAWTAAAGDRLSILRLAGIYGPERNALQRLREGTARRIVKPGHVSNRIHVGDAAQAIAAAFAHPTGGIWNVCDDEPAPPDEVIAFAAALLDLPEPPAEDFADASMTAMARSFYATSNRVRNDRLKSELGVHLDYPTYREGLRNLAQEYARL